MLGGVGPMTFTAARYVLSGVMLTVAAPMLPTPPKKTGREHWEYSPLLGGILGESPHPAPVGGDGGLRPAIGGLDNHREDSPLSETASMWVFGLTLGLLSFIACSAQQIGLQYTSAGKCAFITGFDVALAPVIGLMFPHLTADAPPKVRTWLCVGVSVLGLYLVISSSDAEGGRLGMGEVCVFIGTIFWSFHVVVADIATCHVDVVSLTLVQLLGTGVLCVLSSLVFEHGEWTMDHIQASWGAIAVLGVCECLGGALLVLGQSQGPPLRSAVIMSFEAVFTVVVGFFFLHEILSKQEFLGCILMVVSFVCIRWDMQACEFLAKCTHRLFN
jgi:drug/metabolite transporter (DMT)-like permease